MRFLNFYFYFTIDPSFGHHLCFDDYRTATNKTGQKTILRDKKDITGHIVSMSPCHRPDKGTSMWYMRLFCHTTVSWSKQGTKPSIFGFEWLPVNTVLPLLSLQSLEVKIRLNYPFFYFGQEIIPDVFFFTSMWRLISPARRHLHNWKIEG